MTEAHLSDDELELLVLKKLEPKNEVEAETHILRCQACAHRLEEMREYVQAMRDALRELSEGHMP